VALKTIRPEIASHSETFERFKREVKLAHEVADEHVRRVFDLDHRNQPPFLTMEFIEGQTLAARLSRADATKLSKAEALAVIKQIARGLQALHQKGIVHGDLKPGNIMLTLAGGAIQVKICQDYGFRPGAQPASRQYRRFRAHHGHAVLHGPGAVGGGKGTIASDRHIQPAGLPDNSAIAALLGSLGPGKQEETRADAFAAGQIAGSTKRKWDPAMSAYHVSMALSHISWNLQANRMMNNFGATSLNLPSAFNEKCLSHPNLELRFLAINYLVQPGKPALDLLNAFLYARDHPGGTLY
jgi:hypothetical protein